MCRPIPQCPIRCQALYMLMKESCSLAPRPSYQSLQILLRLTPLCWARVILLSGDLGLAFKECRCGNETIRVGALQITVLLLNPCFCGQHPHRTLWISHGIPPRPPSQSRMLKAYFHPCCPTELASAGSYVSENCGMLICLYDMIFRRHFVFAMSSL